MIATWLNREGEKKPSTYRDSNFIKRKCREKDVTALTTAWLTSGATTPQQWALSTEDEKTKTEEPVWVVPLKWTEMMFALRCFGETRALVVVGWKISPASHRSPCVLSPGMKMTPATSQMLMNFGSGYWVLSSLISLFDRYPAIISSYQLIINLISW